MKHFELIARVYDRETCEYIQRFLRIELTEEEARLFQQMTSSIMNRKGCCPFEEKGWCDNNEEPFLNSPLTDMMEDGEHHRFSIEMGCHTTDTEDENKGCGWLDF